ncbi:MAG: hypothetical protein ACKO0M_14260 [Cyanobium sp.]
MESRRLVVWISTAILGFQGVTLAFDLLNCTALSWLYVRVNGFGPGPQQVVQQPGAMPGEGARPSGDVPGEGAVRATSGSDKVSASTSLERFCARPQDRIDDAVNQGLSILAGLALGSSASGRGQGEP